MPIKLIGRTTDFKGKPLWEILSNLKNFGIGRIVIRNRFQRYPEPCYIKILKVSAMPTPEEPYVDRKVRILAEKVFRGLKSPKPVQIDSTTYKADYMLIPKDQEHLYVNSNVKLSEMRILPKETDFPPLLSRLIMQQMKAKGVAAPEVPKLSLCYNFEGDVKNYRLAKENETPTIKLNFSLDESSTLFPKSEETTSSK